MHMHDTIKKKITITHIYEFKLYSLSLTFILISFGYTHEFTLFFFFSFFGLLSFLMIYLYYTLCFLHLINSPITKILKI